MLANGFWVDVRCVYLSQTNDQLDFGLAEYRERSLCPKHCSLTLPYTSFPSSSFFPTGVVNLLVDA